MNIKKLFHSLIPHQKWITLYIISTGLISGFIIYIFFISKAYSYLSDQAEVCINCHVMTPQYETWAHSSHREVADCNNCHVPQDNFFKHYLFKAIDGAKHSAIFTLKLEPQVIKIGHLGKNAVQDNCTRCHTHANFAIMHSTTTVENQKRFCWECHREVPHGRVHSLQASPVTARPGALNNNNTAHWLNELMNKNK